MPTEDVVEMRAGKRVVTTKRFFPGYILVRISPEPGAGGKMSGSRVARREEHPEGDRVRRGRLRSRRP